MRRPIGCLAAAALLLPAMACAPGGGAAAEDPNGPIRIAYMGILTGPNAVKGATDALEMAIDEINANGGIDGRQVEYKAFDTEITPEAASRSTSLALQYNPDAFIGYGVSSGLLASMGSIKSAGVPVLHNTLSSLTSAENLGSDLVFRMGPTTTQYAHAANKYLIDDLGVDSMTMVHTEDSAPTEGAEIVVEDAESKGVDVEERAVPPTVTDLTEPVLAAEDSDAIWEWGYATTDALIVKQATQHGLDIPIMTFTVGTAIVNDLIPKDMATDKVLSVSSCGALALPGKSSKEFVDAYEKRYEVAPHDGLEPRNYDAVYMLKKAIETAGTTDGEAVADALREVSIDGACGHIESDDMNNLYRDVPILKWGGGEPALAKLEKNVESDF